MSRRTALLAVCFFFLPAVFFFFPFAGGRTPFVGDVLYSFHPWLTYAAQNLQAGRLPLWNPYTACGEPFLANPQVMMFFPLAQVFWLFPFAPAWAGFLVLGQALIFAAALCLALRWLGRGRSAPAALLAASALTWSGFVVILWEFPSAVGTIPFVLLFFLFTWTGRRVSLALCTALLFFAGYAPFAYAAAFFGGLGVLWRAGEVGRRSRRIPWPKILGWGGACAVGLLMASAQILPTWEEVRHSLRTAISVTEARSQLLNPFFAVKFLIPRIFDKTAIPYSPAVFDAGLWPVQRAWLNTFFLGTAPFVLALAGLARLRGPSRPFLAAAALLSAALAMGWEPVFSLVRRLPGLAYMTHFFSFALFGLAAAALLCAEGFRETWDRRRAFWVAWGLSAAVPVLLFFSAGAREGLLKGMLEVERLTVSQHLWVRGASAVAAGALGLAGLSMALPLRLRFWGLALLTLGELWVFGRDLHPFTDSSFFHRPLPLARHLQPSSFRLVFDPETLQGPKPMSGETLAEGYQSLRQTLYPNIHLPFRIHAAWGYDVFPLRAFGELRRALSSEKFLGPPLDFLGGAHLLSTRPLPPPARLKARAPQALLYFNDRALPRVTRPSGTVVLSEPEQRLGHLLDRWDPAREVVIEEAAPGGAGPAEGSPAAAAEATWAERPGRLEVASASSEPGWVVWSQVFYPGWEAYSAGRRVRLWRANHAFQAVRTGAGDLRIVFLYRPKLFYLGVGALCAGMAFVGIVLWRRARDAYVHGAA